MELRGAALPLIGTDELAARLGETEIRVVDATWHLPIDPRNASGAFLTAHIPGAVYFDISAVCDLSHPAPHMLPSPGQFADQAGALGLGSARHIVVYDDGEYAAARVWWMFRTFGHARISVLDGGFPKWLSEGRQIKRGAPSIVPDRFTAHCRANLVWTMAKMRENLETGAAQVVDARPAARFAGALPEMRPGVAPGHIPNSRNLPYDAVLHPDRTYLSGSAIKTKFRKAGVDIDRPIVATCGSGVSACQLSLALHIAGVRDVPVYDGSWAEWGSYDANPKSFVQGQGPSSPGTRPDAS